MFFFVCNSRYVLHMAGKLPAAVTLCALGSGGVGAGRLQGEAAAKYVVNVVDDHKSIRVYFPAQGFDLRRLGKLGYYEKHLAVLVGESTLAVQIGNAAAYDFDDAFSNIVRFIADDDNIFLKIKTDGEGIAGLSHDEKGEQCVKHRLQTKEEHADEKQQDVEQKIGGTDADRIVFLNNGTDNIRTAAAAAYPVHAGCADAVQHAAGNAGQHGIVYGLIAGHKMEEIQRRGKDQHAVKSADGVFPVHIFISDDEKGNIAHDAGNAHRQPGDVVGQHGNAADAAAE